MSTWKVVDGSPPAALVRLVQVASDEMSLEAFQKWLRENGDRLDEEVWKAAAASLMELRGRLRAVRLPDDHPKAGRSLDDRVWVQVPQTQVLWVTPNGLPAEERGGEWLARRPQEQWLTASPTTQCPMCARQSLLALWDMLDGIAAGRKSWRRSVAWTVHWAKRAEQWNSMDLLVHDVEHEGRCVFGVTSCRGCGCVLWSPMAVEVGE